jgi:hypothetical protein
MGTPGSPPTRLTVIPDKWVRPTRRPTDMSVDPTDLVGGPHDLKKTFQKNPQTTFPRREDSLACKTRQSRRIKAAWISLPWCKQTRDRFSYCNPSPNIRRARASSRGQANTCYPQTIDKSSCNLATPAIQTEELDVGFYSPEARTNIKSLCPCVSSWFLCATLA